MKIFLALFTALLCLAGCHNNSSTAMSNPMASMSPEQVERNMIEAGMLTERHGVLKTLAGEWNAKAKFWMDPSQAPELSKGRASSYTIYGGRFLKTNYSGSFMGKPFEGQAMMGYDNVNNQYFTSWIDSMSTMMMTSSGDMLGSDKIVLTSSTTCPMTRETTQGEEILTIINDNHYRWEAYQIQGSDKIKMMEIDYHRAG